MNKRAFPEYQKKLNAAKSVLHESDNKYARALLGRISTCTDTADAVNIHNDIESGKIDGNLTDTEYKALTDLHNYVVADGDLLPTIQIPNAKLTDILRKRIWSEVDVSKVIQFRNCITDLLMLSFVDMTEYIELSNEVDRYIHYTLTNGGIK